MPSFFLWFVIPTILPLDGAKFPCNDGCSLWFAVRSHVCTWSDNYNGMNIPICRGTILQNGSERCSPANSACIDELDSSVRWLCACLLGPFCLLLSRHPLPPNAHSVRHPSRRRDLMLANATTKAARLPTPQCNELQSNGPLECDRRHCNT